MAVDTSDRIWVGYIPVKHLENHILMALNAVVLQDAAVLFFDHDWFMKILQCESQRVVITVFGFGYVFGDERVGEVTVNADRHGVVTRLLPGVVLRIHDMAVYTGFGVSTQIRQTFGILKCKQTNADEQS